MRCTKCEFENPDGMKFCGQCTAPLALICPKCRFQNPPGFKFCGQCTAALLVRRNHNRQIGPSEVAAQSVLPGASRRIRARGRAQDGHGAVRRHQGLDRDDGGSRPRKGARDHRSGAEADDGRGPSLRRLRRAVHRRRHLRAVRRARRARGPSATRTVRRAADAGRVAPLFGKGGAPTAALRSRAASGSTPAKSWSARFRLARVMSSTRQSGIPPTWRRGCRPRRRSVRSR